MIQLNLSVVLLNVSLYCADNVDYRGRREREHVLFFFETSRAGFLQKLMEANGNIKVHQNSLVSNSNKKKLAAAAKEEEGANKRG